MRLLIQGFILSLVLSGVSAAHPRPGPVWAESSMVKIRPQTQPRVEREVDLVGARNEYLSFQVGLHGGTSGLRDVRARLPALWNGLRRIDGPDILLYREALLDITRPTPPDTEPGRWPDGLIPDVDEVVGEQRSAFPFDVPAREARGLWVDVHVPEDARPGRYHGLVEVTGRGLREYVKVRVTVVEATLSSTPSLRTAFLLWPPHVCRAFTGDPSCPVDTQVRLLKQFHQLALSHRFTLASAFPRLPEQPTWDLPDYDTFDARWGPFLDGSAPNPLPGARMTSLQYLGPGTAPDLAEFEHEARTRGWLSRSFDYVGDEPPYGTSWEAVTERARLTRAAAPDLRTFLTTTVTETQAHGLIEDIDILSVLVNFIDGTQPPYEGNQRPKYDAFLARPNRELWLYQSCMSHGCVEGEPPPPENQPGQGWPSYMVDRSAAKARGMQWLTFRMGATGELYYQTVGLLSTAWTTQFRFNGNGDGTLFYPGLTSVIGGTTEVPLPSIRLKLIRQGLQDYEWLQRVSDAGDPSFAMQVAEQLIPHAWAVPDDGALFERARLRLIRRYLELRARER
ncbi:DUF4091 domain-containing protein [Myxococcus llanfairpwllgwyngyllgogerychwyrndrobwllllantysiliogogogochensis]|uniref:DUF4091 domain-containing protein n=1 Tax=Myxococcus llanfairpwllgwyngyllgogerychwyrndrobwllllantysiliogogogochensis TaxID=2590453 RepID=A0A540WM15_9BACT|nr:DUF4091 domain-containing protein [Myxococcus llanfairpwllgwyngyllgogerychwyrndrobwllllantysiliogogogochensis]TQF10062.1 DUF4091 domain-containing protein [Myxococcus llanfairpwllgwyngyllgogerychwyrndrobwllllantysiliogogogochensis]